VASHNIKSEHMGLRSGSSIRNRFSHSTSLLSRRLALLALLDLARRLGAAIVLIAGKRLTSKKRGPESVVESISAFKVSPSTNTSGAGKVSWKGREVYLRDSKCKGAGFDQHVWSSFYPSSSGTSISQ
jgi:hypothetical protein